jgi:hypothetical protein
VTVKVKAKVKVEVKVVGAISGYLIGWAECLELQRRFPHKRHLSHNPHPNVTIKMSRPCQKRRASAAASRKSKPQAKPAGPPPIRHKARQKAIHNARREERGARGRRGGARGGRYQTSGGKPPRYQQGRGNESEQDFISFADSGNNFEALHRAGSRRHPIDVDDSLEDREFSDSEDLDDEEYDPENMVINLEEDQPRTGGSRPPRATVMFTVPAAVMVYKQLYRANFTLLPMTSRTRYGLYQEDTSADSGASGFITFEPSPVSRRASASSATSVEVIAEPEIREPEQQAYNPARDYVFDWGAKQGMRFSDLHNTNDNYLRMIGGQLHRYTKTHLGLEAAFEYYRPGQARLQPPGQPAQARPSQARPSQAPPPPPRTQVQQPAPRGGRQSSSSNAPALSDTYRFHKGAYEGQRLYDVPETYLRTIEGQGNVVNNWPGLRDALQDYNRKTGRRGRF